MNQGIIVLSGVEVSHGVGRVAEGLEIGRIREVFKAKGLVVIEHGCAYINFIVNPDLLSTNSIAKLRDFIDCLKAGIPTGQRERQFLVSAPLQGLCDRDLGADSEKWQLIALEELKVRVSRPSFQV